MTHYKCVLKFIPTPQAIKIPVAKAAVDKEVEEARNDSSRAVCQCKEQKKNYSGSTKRERRVHFATLMDICHLKNSESELQTAEIQRSSLNSEVTL